MPRPTHRQAFLALLGLYLLLALTWSVRVPLWEAPDAIWHYQFVVHLARGGGLPTRADQGLDAPWRQQGSQPPLYYLLTAPLVAAVDTSDQAEVIRFNPHAAVGVASPGGNVNRMLHSRRERFPWRGTVLAAHLVGLAGVAFGAVAVWATWAAARIAFPRRPAVALAAAGLLAFNPQFLFLSGAISNDIAAAATGALLLWRALAVLRAGPTPGRCAWLGVATGLAVLAKLSGLWLVPVALLAIGVAVWDPGSEEGRCLRLKTAATLRRLPGPLTRFALPALAIGGWWYARNLVLFGDPTGLPLMLSVMTPRQVPPSWRELGLQLVAVWKSFWAVFGWFNVPAPGWVYGLVTAISLVGLAGVLLLLRRAGFRRPLVLATIELGLMVVALLIWARVRYPQGRLLFPAAPALALLVAAGWVAWLPERVGRRVAGGLSVLLVLLSAWLLAAVVLPAYHPTPPTPAPSPPPPPVARFGRLVLQSYRIQATGPVEPGEGFRVVLKWRVRPPPEGQSDRGLDRDYSIFLHLIDPYGLIVAQRDSFPDAGRGLTSEWSAYAPEGMGTSGAPGGARRPLAVYTDVHYLAVPAEAEAPCDCRLVVGVYDHLSGERLPTADGHDAYQLATVRLEPAVGPDGIPNPLERRFGDDILLAGYELDRRAAPAGESFRLTLYWRAERRVPTDYKVSVQLRRGAEEKWAQHDEEPADGRRPTSGWRPGEVIVDRHLVTIYPAAPPDVYTLYVKLYDPHGQALAVDYRAGELALGHFRVLAGEGD